MNDPAILLDFIVRCQVVLCSLSGGSAGADVDMYFHSLKNGNLIHYSNIKNKQRNNNTKISFDEVMLPACGRQARNDKRI